MERKLPCHFYHVSECINPRCSFDHSGYPQGRCPGRQCTRCRAAGSKLVPKKLAPCHYHHVSTCTNTRCTFSHSIKPKGYCPGGECFKCQDRFGEGYDEEEYDFGYDDYGYEEEGCEKDKKTKETKKRPDDFVAGYEKSSESDSADDDKTDDLTNFIYHEILRERLEAKKDSLNPIENRDIENAKKIQNEIENFKSLDLVFMIDCTGSMSRFILMAKTEIGNIIKKTKELCKNFTFRVAIIGYRDFDLGSKSIETFPFGTPEDASIFLENLKAHGGKDGPEDVNGGFQKALELDWNDFGGTRVLVHIADAPCHGKEFHDIEKDTYPDGHPNDKDFQTLFKEMDQKKISYLFLEITKHTKKMTEKFREFFSKAKSIGHKTIFESKQISKLNEEDDFSAFISEILKESFLNAFTSTCMPTNSNELKMGKWVVDSLNLKFEVVPTDKPDWSSGLTETGEFESVFYFSGDLDTTPNRINNKIKVEVNPNPFASGTFSLAYYCRVHLPWAVSKKYVTFDVVLKKPKIPQEESYFEQGLIKNLNAVILAKLYNDALRRADIPLNERIYFTRTLKISNGKDTYFIEGYLKGTFEKYTNNAFYVNEKVPITPLMTAFSHYCWEKTNREYMVTDLQGVGNLLTDPAIHSKKNIFLEHGDFSKEGMMKFFTQHQCNKYCKALKLMENSEQKKTSNDLFLDRNTTHTTSLKFFKKCRVPLCNESVAHESDAREGICKQCLEKKVDIDEVIPS